MHVTEYRTSSIPFSGSQHSTATSQQTIFGALSRLFTDVSVNCILSHNQSLLTEELARSDASLPVIHRILASKQVKKICLHFLARRLPKERKSPRQRVSAPSPHQSLHGQGASHSLPKNPKHAFAPPFVRCQAMVGVWSRLALLE